MAGNTGRPDTVLQLGPQDNPGGAGGSALPGETIDRCL